jgi:hypothetical protein
MSSYASETFQRLPGRSEGGPIFTVHEHVDGHVNSVIERRVTGEVDVHQMLFVTLVTLTYFLDRSGKDLLAFQLYFRFAAIVAVPL